MAEPAFDQKTRKDFVSDLVVRALTGPLLWLPYAWRLRIAGWASAQLLGPMLGLNRRIRKNLSHVRPDLSKSEIRQICTKVCDNFGRVMMENLSPEAFMPHALAAKLNGPGLTPMMEAINAGRPVILITGHFGNYQAIRGALKNLGHTVGGIYRPLNNGYTNQRYVENLKKISEPVFSRGFKGTKDMLRHIRGGGITLLLIDQYATEGQDLTFMGKTARTMISAAEFALKYDALLVPNFGIRARNGVDFEVQIESPITHSTAAQMTQDFNDILERVVDQHPGQWFWIHRRWKDRP